jgi:GDP-L-fucose synthase
MSENKVSQDARIFVAGHRGMVGSAIVRRLRENGFDRLLLRTRQELDLRDQGAVDRLFDEQRPEVVFLAAAKVGGILANDRYRADFILENLQIQTNVISAALAHHVNKLVFLGSSCIYPKHAQQPMREDALLTGPLEPTNEAYAVAKIAGIMMCKSIYLQHQRDFISLMPTNLYGINDNYHPENSHVIPALIRRFHEAKERGAESVSAWGTGTALREFLFADDMADAAIFAMNHYSDPLHLNVGSGEEISIRRLTEEVANAVGFRGRIEWDTTKPDGTPRKLMDSSRLRSLGWKPRVTLTEGLRVAYADFLRLQEEGSRRG